MKKYRVCTVLDITQCLLNYNEKTVPELLKLIVKDEQGALEIKYLETAGQPIGRGSVMVASAAKIIKRSEIQVEKQTEYVPDKNLIRSLLATIKTQKETQT